MILTEIKQFVAAEKLTSLQQLSRHFDIAPDALLPMLEVWQRKGVIYECKVSDNCNSACNRCKTNRYYQIAK